jgi:coenzyme F420-reducing hydrogenase delta subunit
MHDFEPQIIAFCCQYCAQKAAVLAGSSGLEYPPNVKIIKLPCTGRIDAIHILRALERGADGLLVIGCMEGECQFHRGNIIARKRVVFVKDILKQIGIEPDRVEMRNLSAHMGKRFADIASDFTAKIKSMGPNPARMRGGGQSKDIVTFRSKKGIMTDMQEVE